MKVAFLGGSITVGSDASPISTMSYWALTRDYLDTLYGNVAVVNAGDGATGPHYALVRLQTDVICHAPDLVVIEFAVNALNYDTYKFASEALIRRLRTSLPNAKLVMVFFTYVNDYTVNDPTNIRHAVKLYWIDLCNHYSIPYADEASEVSRAVLAEEHLVSWYFLDDSVHPGNNGHATAAALLAPQIPILRGPQTGPLPARLYASADYELPPIIRNCVDNNGESGSGWSTVGTSRVSAHVGDTLTWIDTWCWAGIDVSGDGSVFTFQVDGGDWAAERTISQWANNQGIWSDLRALHTVVFKVVSGTVSFNRFIAV